MSVGDFTYNCLCCYCAEDMFLRNLSVPRFQTLIDEANQYKHGLGYNPSKANCMPCGQNPWVDSWLLKEEYDYVTSPWCQCSH